MCMACAVVAHANIAGRQVAGANGRKKEVCKQATPVLFLTVALSDIPLLRSKHSVLMTLVDNGTVRPATATCLTAFYAACNACSCSCLAARPTISPCAHACLYSRMYAPIRRSHILLRPCGMAAHVCENGRNTCTSFLTFLSSGMACVRGEKSNLSLLSLQCVKVYAWRANFSP